MAAGDQAGQVLPNLPGFTDQSELKQFETDASTIRQIELVRNPHLAAGDFDFAHLQRIHRHILQDVYSWAGTARIAGQDTTAMGMAHCRPEFLDSQLSTVFRAVATRRPSSTNKDAALSTVADHWGEMTATHPFLDGNSRSQRFFFTEYMKSAGWTIDWTKIDATAVHAARHVAMSTTDSSFLAEALRPGVDHELAADSSSDSLVRTLGDRDARRSTVLYEQMRDHKRAHRDAASFFSSSPTSAPGMKQAEPSPAERAAALATRGTRRGMPTSSQRRTDSGRAGSTTEQHRRDRGAGQPER